MDDRELDVAKLAISFKGLVLWVGVQYVIAIIGYIAMTVVAEPTLVFVISLLRLIGILVTVLALAVYSYRTAVALGSRAGVLWALADA